VRVDRISKFGTDQSHCALWPETQCKEILKRELRLRRIRAEGR
jgi:hypothetical protein